MDKQHRKHLGRSPLFVLALPGFVKDFAAALTTRTLRRRLVRRRGEALDRQGCRRSVSQVGAKPREAKSEEYAEF